MAGEHEGVMFVHRIDSRDTLIEVNEQWLAFARENGAGHLSKETVLGRNLFSFISDAETSHVYSLLFQRVRKTLRVVSVHFRCDSPGQRRRFLMEIIPRANGVIEMATRVLEIESRPDALLLDPCAMRDTRLVRVCSWCKRVEVEGHGWLEVEDAAERLCLMERETLPGITHAMCRDCFQRMHGDMDAASHRG